MCLFQCCQLKILIPSHLIPLSYLSSIGIYKCPHRSILSYPILSYPILSYPIQSYHIISYHIISYHMVWYGMVWYGILLYRILFSAILCCPLRSNPLIDFIFFNLSSCNPLIIFTDHSHFILVNIELLGVHFLHTVPRTLFAS